MESVCLYCGDTFTAERATARFCSDAHRKAHARGPVSEAEVPVPKEPHEHEEPDALVADDVAPPPTETLLPVASIEELERPSPRPFVGTPDVDYPELDSAEPLYIARFLFRRWGSDRFQHSAYFNFWQHESNRPASDERASADVAWLKSRTS